MMRFVFLAAVICGVVACNDSSAPVTEAVVPVDSSSIAVQQTQDTSVAEDSVTDSAARFTNEVFETPNLGWGYKIYDNGTLFINQPHIPAIQGNKGFSTKEKAQITADFAILKMDQGFIPPTISPEELDSLGVLD